jgi:predicted HTH domain antitoxin
MPLVITDEQLRTMQMSERDALVEIACRLFDAGRLGFHAAMRMTNLDRTSFENELIRRKIAIYRPTVEDLREELENLERSGS